MNKVGEITTMGLKFVVLYKEGLNPFRLYRKYYHNGWHQELIAKYAGMGSCLAHMLDELNGIKYNVGRR